MNTMNALSKRSITIVGLDCPDCAASLEKRIAGLPGVREAKVNLITSKLTVEHTASLESILKAVKDAGYEADQPETAKKTVFRLKGLDCPDCASKLQAKLEATEGIWDVSLNFGAAKLSLSHSIPVETIADIVDKAGYQAVPDSPGRHVVAGEFKKTNPRLYTTAISGLLLAGAWVLSLFITGEAVIALYLTTIFIGGYWTFLRGISSLRARMFDMNVMMTVAVIGAILIGEWAEGAMVAFLYSLSNLLESYTMEKTRKSIRSLMDLAPKEATVRRNGIEARVPVEDVRIGDTVIVKPGEKISVDGAILAGGTTVDQSPITGESVPVDKLPGDEVYAGTVNKQGAVEIRVTKTADDTTLAKIIHLVEEAQSQKAPTQAFVDRFASYYTPAVLILVAGMALIPPLLFSQPWAPWIYRALALVIVACPCALVISTPVAIISAIGNAAKHGVLIKGGAYLEQAGSLRVMAFDKTGTLTRGRLEVTDVLPSPGVSETDLLELAAAIEMRSEHPLAQAIMNRAKLSQSAVPAPDFFEALHGRGAKASFADQVYYVGNTLLFEEKGIPLGDLKANIRTLQQQGKTIMVVGTQEKVLGAIAVADEVRAESAESIRALHAAGIEKVIMLSGDNAETARTIGNRLGLEEVRADLLPQDKVEEVKALLQQYGKVAMVGDGINDAPALATATVGIAMGNAGTDTAMESADIVLMSDDLSKLAYTIRLSRKALQIIKQNIGFSILIKALAVSLIFPGWLTLLLAVLSDMGATILVTLNGMRLLNGKTATARPASGHDHGFGLERAPLL